MTAGLVANATDAESEAVREVGAAVLLRVYWHLKIAELILEGMPPREANELCWKSYYFGPLPLYAVTVAAQDQTGRDTQELVRKAMYPAGGRYPINALTPVPDKGPNRHWTTRCLTAALAEDPRLLATSWDELVRQNGACPRARIGAADTARLTWLCHMLWLLSTGAGDLLHCARVAHDRASGKPARKRQPADPEWLAAELDAGLTACWDAFRSADNGKGNRLWPWPLPAGRPAATGGEESALRHFEADAPRREALRRERGGVLPMHGSTRGVTKSPKRAPRRNRKRR